MVWNLTTKICECSIGTYLVLNTTICAPYPGCIAATNPPAGVVCSNCNNLLHFNLNNGTNTCMCDQYFVLSVDTCIDVCADGINTALNSTNFCDDGNTNDNDGCNSTCAV